MPLLGNLLVSIVTFLVGFFGRYMVLEKAFRISAVLVMLGFFTVVIAAMGSCARGVCAQGIAGMSNSHPAFAVGLGIAFNSTTMAAASCYVTVWLCCQIYVFQKKSLNIVVK